MAPIQSASKSSGALLQVYSAKISAALRRPHWLSDDTSKSTRDQSHHLYRSQIWKKLTLKLTRTLTVLPNYFYQSRRQIFPVQKKHQYKGIIVCHQLSAGKKSWINCRHSRSENLLFYEVARENRMGWWTPGVLRDVADVGFPC